MSYPSMLLLILASTYVAAVFSQCSYNNGDISSRWQVVNGELTIEFINRNIGNNQWTGIGFGPGMSSLEVVLFKIQNNRPSLVTGTTGGYGPPLVDAAANVSPQMINYNRLTFSCMLSLFQFVQRGPVDGDDIGYHTSTPDQIEICPNECRKKIMH
uniref:DOMON domain-containing protein n=1 Tax=Heterorhabditis bacteriophora TaxID=37862 RepID=A0A1I7XEY7_HETBA